MFMQMMFMDVYCTSSRLGRCSLAASIGADDFLWARLSLLAIRLAWTAAILRKQNTPPQFLCGGEFRGIWLEHWGNA